MRAWTLQKLADADTSVRALHTHVFTAFVEPQDMRTQVSKYSTNLQQSVSEWRGVSGGA